MIAQIAWAWQAVFTANVASTISLHNRTTHKPLASPALEAEFSETCFCCEAELSWLLTSMDVVIRVEPASTATDDSAPLPPMLSGIATMGSAGLPEAGVEATDRTLP